MQYTMTDALPIITKILSEGRLSIFAGSGISVESGLPAWDGFIDKYIDICEELNKSLEPCYQFTDIISDAKASKDKNLISTITVLREKLRKSKLTESILIFVTMNLMLCFMEQFHVIIIKQL